MYLKNLTFSSCFWGPCSLHAKMQTEAFTQERVRWDLTGVFDFHGGFVGMTDSGSSQRWSLGTAKEISSGCKEIFFTWRQVIHRSRLCKSPSSELFRTHLKKGPEQLDLILKPNSLWAGGWTRLSSEVLFQRELSYKFVTLHDCYLGLSYLNIVQGPKCCLQLNTLGPSASKLNFFPRKLKVSGEK